MALVTISRQYGAGGSLVAGQVADALGWPLLDNAFVEAVAQGAGVSPEEVAAREERVPSLVERVLRALALGSPEILPALGDAPQPSEERLLAVTRRVIEEAAAAGPVVLVARGAEAVLAERADAFHVFCHAPQEALVARAAQRLAADEATARAQVERVNRRREQYVRTHFDRDWRNLCNYHLSLDTAALGIDGAADLVVTAVRMRFGLATAS